MARILFLITSFRAAAALAVGEHKISDYIATGKVIQMQGLMGAKTLCDLLKTL